MVMLDIFYIYLWNWSDLPYLKMSTRGIPDNSFFTNVAKQMIEEKLFFDDKKSKEIKAEKEI